MSASTPNRPINTPQHTGHRAPTRAVTGGEKERERKERDCVVVKKRERERREPTHTTRWPSCHHRPVRLTASPPLPATTHPFAPSPTSTPNSPPSPAH
ncbi:hypothetical protein TIFTF001_005306 [Ficus carica]|uniref:Uncharacterized protein n=1 Tax=Ficus carica TaxID=3494 RepID=A0AA87ZK90_FICCA|nr:hypothetical protein TIFTF001_005306 [Ficus carica]